MQKGLDMSEVQVDEFIRRSHEEDRLTFPQIAERLKSMGYKSRKNGKALSSATVRFRFYRPKSPSKMERHSLAPTNSPHERTIELVRATLKMKTDPNSKLQLIEKIIEQN